MYGDAAVAAGLARVVDELRTDSPSMYTVSQRAKATGRSTIVQDGREAQIGERQLTADDADRETSR